VLAEVFRAGIQSVPRGQTEAAYAIGLHKAQVMRLVLAPQAVRIMLPAIISQSVVALKDSALGLIIAYEELARVGRQLYVFYNNPLAVGVVIAAIYIAINYTLSKLAVMLEARQRRIPRTATQPGGPAPAAATTEPV
jgi:glutamate transport system permease protein